MYQPRELVEVIDQSLDLYFPEKDIIKIVTNYAKIKNFFVATQDGVVSLDLVSLVPIGKIALTNMKALKYFGGHKLYFIRIDKLSGNRHPWVFRTTVGYYDMEANIELILNETEEEGLPSANVLKWGNNIYITDPVKGITIYDFETDQRIGIVEDIKILYNNIKVYQGRLYVPKNTGLYVYDMETLKLVLPVANINIDNISFHDGLMYCLDNTADDSDQDDSKIQVYRTDTLKYLGQLSDIGAVTQMKIYKGMILTINTGQEDNHIVNIYDINTQERLDSFEITDVIDQHFDIVGDELCMFSYKMLAKGEVNISNKRRRNQSYLKFINIKTRQERTYIDQVGVDVLRAIAYN